MRALAAALLFAAPAFAAEPVPVEVRCEAEPCPSQEDVTAWLAKAWERMPRLLAPARPTKVVWETVSGRPADGSTSHEGEITLYAPPGRDMTAIFAHELAHVLEKADAKTCQDFLKLRHDTQEYRTLLGEFWYESERSRGPDEYSERPLNPRARALLSQMRLPRRHPEDLHAAKSRREYWAVAVELVFIEWSAGRSAPLDAFMSADEEAYLRSRF